MTLTSIREGILVASPCTSCAIDISSGREFLIIFLREDGRIEAEMAIFDPIYLDQNTVEVTASSILTKSSATINSLLFVEPSMGLGSHWVLSISLNDHSVELPNLWSNFDSLNLELSTSGLTPGNRELRLAESRASVLSALRQGNEQAIIGLAERSWLEFKSQLSVETDSDRVELAQDIARFANSESGGILAFGYRTKRQNGIDRVEKRSPFAALKGIEPRLQSIIDYRVYPPIRGLEIIQTQAGGGRVFLTILVPSQVEADKPFLVHGAIIAGKTEGVFFSITRRRGEGSVPITAREVHALLAAGYSVSRERNEKETP